MSALIPGTLFASDFRVERVLSTGGMGTVYVAEQLSTGKRRALKLMLPELVQDARLRARFEQEARVGSRVESEHVVEVVAAGVDDATRAPWLAMELLEGEDLAAWRQRRASVDPRDARRALEELCHAVGAAHRVGIVHRDLKPENLFVAKSKRVGADFMLKVLDFGIAKLMDEARSTRTAAVGTPLWMAPEQTEAGAIVSPASDVWAIGLIAFWLLTGRSYWRGGNVENPSVGGVLREVVIDPIVPASVRAAELGATGMLPPGFDAWFARAVAREPASRFPEATSAFAALAPLLDALTLLPPMRQEMSSSPAFMPGAPPPNPYPGAFTPAGVAGTPQATGGRFAGRREGMGCWSIGLIVAGVLFVLGVGSCGALLYAGKAGFAETCQDDTQSDAKRIEACEDLCGFSFRNDDEAKACAYLGDLYTKQGKATKAKTAYGQACDKGDTESCPKR